MTKEQAMAILNLEEGFTYDDLYNAFERLTPKSIEFHAKHNGRNRDLIEAYNFLKKNKLYEPLDDSADFTILSQRSKRQSIQNVMKELEEAKKNIAKIIKGLDVFIKVGEDDFVEDAQITIFNNNPVYLKTYAIDLKAKAEEFKKTHSSFREFSDFTNFINDYDAFNSYVEKCYKEIILVTLKDNNLIGWNAEQVFKAIFWQNINPASEAPEKAFYRSYLSVKDLYKKIMQTISKDGKFYRMKFHDKIDSLFLSWQKGFGKYLACCYHIDYNQVYGKAIIDLKKELESYSSYKQISDRFLAETFFKILDFYAEKSAEKNYVTEVKSIWNSKLKTYYEESFGSFYVVGGSLIEESQKAVDKKYGFNSKIRGVKKVKEIENYMDSLLLPIVKKGQRLFYQIKALMDKYPEFGSYVRNANYGLEEMYQKFNGELLAKLRELVPDFDAKGLTNLPLNEHLNKEDYQPITSFDEQLNSGTYLVYKGHDITWEDINAKMSKYLKNGEQARMIFEDGIIFAKNVPTEDIKNNNIYEPTIYCNYCWTITDFDFEKLKQLVPDSKVTNTSELLKGLSIYDRNSVLRDLERNIDFSCFSYNYLTNRLLIIVNNAPVYIGYPIEGEIMYSNNASLLKEFCPVVYKLPSKFYSLNEECYEKKDGMDLLIRSLKI